MTFRFFICGAVLLTATVVAAQDRVAEPASPQQTTAATAERRATEKMAQAQAAGAVFARVPLETKFVKDAPYSAEIVTESIQVLGDGNRIVHRTTGRVYRDSQGRTRREEDIEPGRSGSISISDPVARDRVLARPAGEDSVQDAGRNRGRAGGTYTVRDAMRAIAPTGRPKRHPPIRRNSNAAGRSRPSWWRPRRPVEGAAAVVSAGSAGPANDEGTRRRHGTRRSRSWRQRTSKG